MATSLADGQLATSATSLLTYTSSLEQRLMVTLANTSASLTETITLTYQRQGGTSRRLAQIILAPNEAAIVNGISVDSGDTLLGATTDATTVDFVVSKDNTSSMDMIIKTYDKNGNLKSAAAAPALPPAQFKTMNVTTGTLAVGQASGAAYTSLTSTNATPGSQAMRTVAQVLADTPGLAVGMSYVLRITNTGAGTLTLATDSGTQFTMTGTMTVPQNTTRDFIVTINTATTGTVQAIGVGTFS